MYRLVTLLVLIVSLAGCGSPTPVTEIDATPLIYQEGDLLYLPGPVLPMKPDVLSATPSATRVATMTFQGRGIDMGMATVLVYDSNEKAETAFSTVRDQIKGNSVADLADQAADTEWEAVINGPPMLVYELVTRRCRTVAHFRFDRTQSSPEAIQAYAKKIDARVQALGC